MAANAKSSYKMRYVIDFDPAMLGDESLQGCHIPVAGIRFNGVFIQPGRDDGDGIDVYVLQGPSIRRDEETGAIEATTGDPRADVDVVPNANTPNSSKIDLDTQGSYPFAPVDYPIFFRMLVDARRKADGSIDIAISSSKSVFPDFEFLVQQGSKEEPLAWWKTACPHPFTLSLIQRMLSANFTINSDGTYDFSPDTMAFRDALEKAQSADSLKAGDSKATNQSR